MAAVSWMPVPVCKCFLTALGALPPVCAHGQASCRARMPVFRSVRIRWRITEGSIREMRQWPKHQLIGWHCHVDRLLSRYRSTSQRLQRLNCADLVGERTDKRLSFWPPRRGAHFEKIARGIGTDTGSTCCRITIGILHSACRAAGWRLGQVSPFRWRTPPIHLLMFTRVGISARFDAAGHRAEAPETKR